MIRTKWLVILGVLFLTSCGDDSREALEITLDADSNQVFTFEADVRPILDEFCVTCHPNTDPIPLISFEQVRDQATLISNAINGRPGSVRMPLGRSFPAINVQTIDAWIAGGLIEN